MLAGSLVAWIVALGSSAPPEAPKDPWVGTRGSDVAFVRGDIVDPFRPTGGDTGRARGSEPAFVARLDLKDPFAPDPRPAPARVRSDKREPDLVDPFARPVEVVGDEPACAPKKASNGATLQRAPNVPAPRCDPPRRPALRNPFGP